MFLEALKACLQYQQILAGEERRNSLIYNVYISFRQRH